MARRGAVQTAASHHCPSIRDNYGLPLEEARIGCYFQNFGPGSVLQLAPTQTLGFQTELTPRQYMPLARHWITLLETSSSPAEALYAIIQFLQKMETPLLEQESVPEELFTQWLYLACGGGQTHRALRDAAGPTGLG